MSVPILEVVDLHAAYAGATIPLYVDGMHLSVEGHRVAGEAIGAALAEMLAFPPA